MKTTTNSYYLPFINQFQEGKSLPNKFSNTIRDFQEAYKRKRKLSTILLESQVHTFLAA